MKLQNAGRRQEAARRFGDYRAFGSWSITLLPRSTRNDVALDFQDSAMPLAPRRPV
jgi:hypothetical protein